jgi:hypothetical protein
MVLVYWICLNWRSGASNFDIFNADNETMALFNNTVIFVGFVGEFY